ncbi:MAG: energy transducer TonB [Acidobacteriota bacterium]
MFETVSTETKRSRALWFETLPASLGIHALIAGVVVFGALNRISFPDQPPAMREVYNLVEIPPPPPPPPPPPAAAKDHPVQQSTGTPRVEPEEIVAPNFIPDEIIPASAPVVALTGPEGPGGGEGVEGGIEGGVVGGVLGGDLAGVAGGAVGGTPGGTEGGVVYVERDQPLHMFPLSQVYPSYPEKARLQRWEDRLVVRYVIGTNGRIKEVKIIEPATRTEFNEAALHAIRHWRFRPMIKDGQAQEVVHELTIFYKMQV